MLTRIRIEVEGEDSAAAAEAALTKYEHALQVTEAQRCGIGYVVEPGNKRSPEFAKDGWKQPVVERDFYNDKLGREVTDEVIEFDPSIPGYKGRRVVQFRRLRLREPTSENTSHGHCSVQHLDESHIQRAVRRAVRQVAAVDR